MENASFDITLPSGKSMQTVDFIYEMEVKGVFGLRLELELESKWIGMRIRIAIAPNMFGL